MATITDALRTKMRRAAARSGVSGLGVKEDIARIRSKVADIIRPEEPEPAAGLGIRSRIADIIEGRRSAGLSVASRLKNVVRGVRSAGLRRTGSLMLQGERPLRRWARIGPRRRYIEFGEPSLTVREYEDSSVGGAMEKEWTMGATNMYLADEGETRVRNIQS